MKKIGENVEDSINL